MPDVFTKQKRSEVMSRIRGRGNKETEIALMQIFRRNKISGWRRQALIKFKIKPSVAKDAMAGGNVKLKIKNTGHAPASTRLRPGRGKAWTPNGGKGSEISNLKFQIKTVRVDFVFPKLKLVVLVDGCFWHGCPKHWRLPRGNRSFWREKFTRNKERDRLVNRTLRQHGWRVVRIWEHELKNEAQCVRRINTCLTTRNTKRNPANAGH